MRVNRELALVLKGNWKTSEAIVDVMLKANVAPSQRTLSLLIQQCRERNQPKRAELMLNQLAGRTTQGTVSSHVLTSLDDYWYNASNLKRVEEIVAGMEADGSQPSVAVYTVINDGRCVIRTSAAVKSSFSVVKWLLTSFCACIDTVRSSFKWTLGWEIFTVMTVC
jgi:hypothetical protein